MNELLEEVFILPVDKERQMIGCVDKRKQLTISIL